MSSPYMPLYIADYMADTSHLSMQEHGAYLLLIMTYWQTGKPLPNDHLKLARICRTDTKTFRRVSKNVIELFLIEDGKLYHPRVEKELLIYKEKCDKSRAAGIKSGESRRNKRSTNDERPFNKRSSLVEPQTNHSESESLTIVKEKNFKKEKSKNKRPFPNDFCVTDEHRSWAIKNGCPNPDVEFDGFKDHWLACGEGKVDWDATFRTWLRRGKKFQQQRGSNHATNQRSAPKSKSQLVWDECAPGAFKGTIYEDLYPNKT